MRLHKGVSPCECVCINFHQKEFHPLVSQSVALALWRSGSGAGSWLWRLHMWFSRTLTRHGDDGSGISAGQTRSLLMAVFQLIAVNLYGFIDRSTIGLTDTWPGGRTRLKIELADFSAPTPNQKLSHSQAHTCFSMRHSVSLFTENWETGISPHFPKQLKRIAIPSC
ncbi:uncharacterized protein YALI1_D06094g [Yarrowia lipolytica]|uniref:Uncharacterized protein n=1 Tax=Yarrowia lipolytica TaxID=4952 RepID=A0A1D8ND77_YARLL|nr:hypothetical protein YALI1_D06094g [Yarrowia lipolytica]